MKIFIEISIKFLNVMRGKQVCEFKFNNVWLILQIEIIWGNNSINLSVTIINVIGCD
jgi:hypothetical protein